MDAVVIDYGTGNISSIQNMIKKVGYKSQITSDISIIEKAERIILPGVGSFDFGMNQIKKLGLYDIINHKVTVEKVPTLGICLGMQLMSSGSEEGVIEGFNWFNGKLKKFAFNDQGVNRKVPNMGWRQVEFINKELNEAFHEDPRFYFVHSFYYEFSNSEEVFSTTNYGFKFTCGLKKENIVGVQFHPEKSHKFGKVFFERFFENSL
tara:strand:- start:447 stop:1067 length:621 start_codon:yes stop_codon:yes gene_type:complete